MCTLLLNAQTTPASDNYYLKVNLEMNGRIVEIDTSFSDMHALNSYMEANHIVLPEPPAPTPPVAATPPPHRVLSVASAPPLPQLPPEPPKPPAAPQRCK